mmetsp:Transcript_18368/g.31687  ORF Transcript_18368/g.31687 Transcript_18368/m.31687 type:complete len:228 (+) Transcript_18368:1002-1685(+)
MRFSSGTMPFTTTPSSSAAFMRRRTAPTSGPWSWPVRARRRGMKRRLPLRPRALPRDLMYAFHSASSRCTSSFSSPAAALSRIRWATSARPSSMRAWRPSAPGVVPAMVSSRGYDMAEDSCSTESVTLSMLPLNRWVACCMKADSVLSGTAASLGATRPDSTHWCSSSVARVGSSRLRMCWALIQVSLPSSNTAADLVMRSSENFETMSWTEKTSCSVPSFHPRSDR